MPVAMPVQVVPELDSALDLIYSKAATLVDRNIANGELLKREFSECVPNSEGMKR